MFCKISNISWNGKKSRDAEGDSGRGYFDLDPKTYPRNEYTHGGGNVQIHQKVFDSTTKHKFGI